jgi:hypothetical protein
MVLIPDERIDGRLFGELILGLNVTSSESGQSEPSVLAQKIEPVGPFQDIPFEHPLVALDGILSYGFSPIGPELSQRQDISAAELPRLRDDSGHGLFVGEGLVGPEEKPHEKHHPEHGGP